MMEAEKAEKDAEKMLYEEDKGLELITCALYGHHIPGYGGKAGIAALPIVEKLAKKDTLMVFERLIQFLGNRTQSLEPFELYYISELLSFCHIEICKNYEHKCEYC